MSSGTLPDREMPTGATKFNQRRIASGIEGEPLRVDHVVANASGRLSDDELTRRESNTLDGENQTEDLDVPTGHIARTAEERTLHRRLNRKLDLAILPLLSLLYLFNGLDRGNVGNAQTQGEAILVTFLMIPESDPREPSAYSPRTQYPSCN